MSTNFDYMSSREIYAQETDVYANEDIQRLLTTKKLRIHLNHYKDGFKFGGQRALLSYYGHHFDKEEMSKFIATHVIKRCVDKETIFVAHGTTSFVREEKITVPTTYVFVDWACTKTLTGRDTLMYQHCRPHLKTVVSDLTSRIITQHLFQYDSECHVRRPKVGLDGIYINIADLTLTTFGEWMSRVRVWPSKKKAKKDVKDKVNDVIHTCPKCNTALTDFRVLIPDNNVSTETSSRLTDAVLTETQINTESQPQSELASELKLPSLDETSILLNPTDTIVTETCIHPETNTDLETLTTLHDQTETTDYIISDNVEVKDEIALQPSPKQRPSSAPIEEVKRETLQDQVETTDYIIPEVHVKAIRRMQPEPSLNEQPFSAFIEEIKRKPLTENIFHEEHKHTRFSGFIPPKDHNPKLTATLTMYDSLTSHYDLQKEETEEREVSEEDTEDDSKYEPLVEQSKLNTLNTKHSHNPLPVPRKVDLSDYHYLTQTNITDLKLYHYIGWMLDDGITFTEPLILSQNSDDSLEEFMSPDGDVFYDPRIGEFVVALWERTGLMDRLTDITDEEVITYLSSHKHDATT